MPKKQRNEPYKHGRDLSRWNESPVMVVKYIGDGRFKRLWWWFWGLLGVKRKHATIAITDKGDLTFVKRHETPTTTFDCTDTMAYADLLYKINNTSEWRGFIGDAEETA